MKSTKLYSEIYIIHLSSKPRRSQFLWAKMCHFLMDFFFFFNNKYGKPTVLAGTDQSNCLHTLWTSPSRAMRGGDGLHHLALTLTLMHNLRKHTGYLLSSDK